MTSGEPAVELVTFRCRECYVFAIPRGTVTSSIGHRAETWGLDKWQSIVSCRLVESGDQATLRLEDLQSGELFAACPLPSDGGPATSAVEPVVDSARYFVLKIVDNCEGKERHAFIGIGFPQREMSSELNAAIDSWVQTMRRQRMSEKMAAEASPPALEHDCVGVGCEQCGAKTSKFRLADGQTLRISLKASTASAAATRAVAVVPVLKAIPPPQTPIEREPPDEFGEFMS